MKIFGRFKSRSVLHKKEKERFEIYIDNLSLQIVFKYYDRNLIIIIGNSYAYYSRQRYMGHKCSGKMERSPAGYSELSVQCIKGCAKNYRCKFGKYRLFRNNCHKFANRLSAVLCRKGTTCPFWCQGSCNHAKPS